MAEEDPEAAAARMLKAFDFAQESLKQVLALATGSLGGAIALFDDGSTAGLDMGPDQCTVMWGLSLLIGSIAFGLLGLFNLSGTLDTPPRSGITIYKGSIQFFWGGHLLLFVAGLIVLVAAAF